MISLVRLQLKDYLTILGSSSGPKVLGVKTWKQLAAETLQEVTLMVVASCSGRKTLLTLLWFLTLYSSANMEMEVAGRR